jgi:hypothetical protein
MRWLLFALVSLAMPGCAKVGLPNECEDGCVDFCKQSFVTNRAACSTDYNQGYALGYDDGLKNRLTDGVNSDSYVAGYWDGHADGLANGRYSTDQ